MVNLNPSELRFIFELVNTIDKETGLLLRSVSYKEGKLSYTYTSEFTRYLLADGTHPLYPTRDHSLLHKLNDDPSND